MNQKATTMKASQEQQLSSIHHVVCSDRWTDDKCKIHVKWCKHFGG